MVMSTPTGETCPRCGGPMMQGDARELGDDGECTNGCDAFPSTRFIRSYEAIESLSEDAVRKRDGLPPPDCEPQTQTLFRCTAVGCGFEGYNDGWCPVCGQYSLVRVEH